MPGMLVLFHCESNPGFAASTHEHTFLAVAKRLVGNADQVHFAYRTLKDGMTPGLASEVKHTLELRSSVREVSRLRAVEAYVREHNIQFLLGFDQPPRFPMYSAYRRGGVRHFVSYWGAPMSSVNRGPKLWLKSLDMLRRGPGPDHYIFQSDDMRRTATHGRGIPAHRTSVVRTGIDTVRYAPDLANANYPHRVFGIPENRKVVFFSGHMEERKGVHIVLKAAVHLVEQLGVRDAHFLILGNREGQEAKFDSLYRGTAAESHITFGGYRNDVPALLQGCSLGIIASTGWDSFPMSSLEMAATELPLIVSDLPGLRETITPETGVTFPTGDHVRAAELIQLLLSDDSRRGTMGKSGRERVLARFSRDLQVAGIERVFRTLMAR